MKQRIISAVLAGAMCFSTVPPQVYAAEVPVESAVVSVQEEFAKDSQTIVDGDFQVSAGANLQITSLRFQGNSTLTIEPGATLTVTQGIWVESGTLTINNSGKLIATGAESYPAIGGVFDSTVNLVGGVYDVTGGKYAAAIGGAQKQLGPTVIVRDADITAYAGLGAAAIGSGHDGYLQIGSVGTQNPLEFYNSIIHAEAVQVGAGPTDYVPELQYAAAAIGGGHGTSAGPIHVEGCSLYLTSGNKYHAPGLGSGYLAMTTNLYTGHNNYIESSLDHYGTNPQRYDNLYKWDNEYFKYFGYQIEGNPVISQGITVDAGDVLKIPAGNTLTVKGGIVNNGVIDIEEGGTLNAEITGNVPVLTPISYINQNGETVTTQTYTKYTNQSTLIAGVWLIPNGATVTADQVNDGVILVLEGSATAQIAASGTVHVFQTTSAAGTLAVEAIRGNSDVVIYGVDTVFRPDSVNVSNLTVGNAEIGFEGTAVEAYVTAQYVDLSDNVRFDFTGVDAPVIFSTAGMRIQATITEYPADAAFTDCETMDGYVVTSSKNVTQVWGTPVSTAITQAGVFTDKEIVAHAGSSLDLSPISGDPFRQITAEGTVTVSSCRISALSGNGQVNISGNVKITDASQFTGTVSGTGASDTLYVGSTNADMQIDIKGTLTFDHSGVLDVIKTTVSAGKILDNSTTRVTADDFTGNRSFVYTREDLFGQIEDEIRLKDQRKSYEINGVPVTGIVKPEDWEIQTQVITEVGVYDIVFKHIPSGATFTVPVSVTPTAIDPSVMAPSSVVYGDEVEITVDTSKLVQESSALERIAAVFGVADDKIGAYLNGILVSDEVILGDQTRVTLTVDTDQFVNQDISSAQFTIKYSGSATYQAFDVASPLVSFVYADLDWAWVKDPNSNGWFSSKPQAVAVEPGAELSVDGKSWADILSFGQEGSNLTQEFFIRNAAGQIGKARATYSYTTQKPAFDFTTTVSDLTVSVEGSIQEAVAPVHAITYTCTAEGLEPMTGAVDANSNTFAFEIEGLSPNKQYMVELTVANVAGLSTTVSRPFETPALDVSMLTIEGIANKTYIGGEITQDITVTDTATGIVLVEGRDYTVAYENNITVGTASMTITGIGNYAGQIVKQFQIVPASVSVEYTGTVEHVFDGTSDIQVDPAAFSFSTGSFSADDFAVEIEFTEVLPGAHTAYVVVTLNNPNYKLDSNRVEIPIEISAKPVSIAFGSSFVTSSSVTVSAAVENPVDGVYADAYTMEYKLGKDGQWTTNSTWTDLDPNTTYTVYARLASSEVYTCDDVVETAVTTQERTLTGWTIKTLPDFSYVSGNAFSLDGLQIELKFDNGNTETVSYTSETADLFNSSVPAGQILTVKDFDGESVDVEFGGIRHEVGSISVSKRNVTVDFSAGMPSEITFSQGATVDLIAVSTGSDPVYSVVSGNDSAYVDGTALVITKPGTVTVRADAAETEETFAASAEYTLAINKMEGSGTVQASGYVWGMGSLAPSVADASSTGVITWYANKTNSNENGTKLESFSPDTLDAGVWYVYAVIGADDFHKEFTTQPVDITVEKAKIAVSGLTGQVYVGSSLKDLKTGINFSLPMGLRVEGDFNWVGVDKDFVFEGEAGSTVALTWEFTPKAVRSIQDNIDMSKITGEFTVTLVDKKVPQVTVTDFSKNYDGQAVTADQILEKFSSNAPGSWTIKDLGDIKNAGVYTVTALFSPDNSTEYAAVERVINVVVDKVDVSISFVLDKDVITTEDKLPGGSFVVSGAVAGDVLIPDIEVQLTGLPETAVAGTYVVSVADFEAFKLLVNQLPAAVNYNITYGLSDVLEIREVAATPTPTPAPTDKPESTPAPVPSAAPEGNDGANAGTSAPATSVPTTENVSSTAGPQTGDSGPVAAFAAVAAAAVAGLFVIHAHRRRERDGAN